MSTIRLLSTCYDDNEEARYVIIELVSEDIKTLAARRKAFLAAKEADKGVFDHRFVAQDATFYEDLTFKDTETESSDGDDPVEADDMLDGANIMFLAEKDEVEKDDSTTLSTELDLAVIDEQGVFWMSLPENKIGDYRTEMITWDKLFEGRL